MNTEIIKLQELLERRFLTKTSDSNAIGFEYLSGNILFNCTVQIDMISKSIFFEGVLSLPFQERHQLTALEWCNCINERLPIGHFAINPDNGFMKFKNGSHFWKEDLTERTMRTLIESSILTIDQYTKSLIFIFNGNAENNNFGKAIELFGDDIGIGISKSCHYKIEKHPSIQRY